MHELMQGIVIKIHLLLTKNKKTCAVAESCTGGLLSKLLTDMPGSSRYFPLGVVAYSNKAKETLLKIPRHLIAKKGAVSREIAHKMAESVKKLASADYGIGVTGIAGPTGATHYKPVGTVFIAVVGKNKKTCKKFKFTGNRAAVRKKTALKALELLKKLI